MRLGIALLLLTLACGPKSVSEPRRGPDSPERAAISIYRLGDKRFTFNSESVYRHDGNNSTLAEIKVDPPVALVVETAKLRLAEGKQTIALPRIPSQAAASSLWLQSLTAKTGVTLESIEPHSKRRTALLGRRVRVDVGGQTVVGLVVRVESNSNIEVRGDDRKLWLVASDRAAVASEAGGEQRPLVSLAAQRGGEHTVEIGYTTESINWRCDYDLRINSAEPTDELAVESKALVTIENATDTGFDNAEVALYSGMLSSTENHPISLWRGKATIGAHSESSVMADTPEMKAAIGFEFRPVVRMEDGDRKEPVWGLSTTTEVNKVLWLTPVEGAALVAGKVTVHAADAIYEAALRDRVVGPATASVRLDRASFLRGRRLQQATRRSRDGTTFTESIELEVQNRSAGDDPVKVRVVELLARSARFEIVKSEPEAKVVGQELVFELDVEPRKSKRARYTVRYSF